LALGDYMGVTCHACIGGTNVRDDMKRLEGGVRIVVGTPGRILALAKSKALNLRHVKHFIIDECDKVLESLGM